VDALRYDSLRPGLQLASVKTAIGRSDEQRLRDLLQLSSDGPLGTLGLAQVVFLRSVLLSKLVPDGAIMTALASRHLAPVPTDIELETEISVLSTDTSRGSRATLGYRISAGGHVAAFVEQTVIWPET
jgi:hypothetical protein